MTYVIARNPAKKRVPTQRSFDLAVSSNQHQTLMYFVQQELGYYNHLIETLSPRIRAFPEDFLSVREKEKTIWESCSEHAIDVRQMIKHDVTQWPKKVQHLGPLLRDTNGEMRIAPGHVQMLIAGSHPSNLHPLVRKQMATEILSCMCEQAGAVKSRSKSNSAQTPVQMLNTHTIDTKRHLQIPASLVNRSYDADADRTLLTIPYLRSPLEIQGYDLSEVIFGTMVLRAPHASATDAAWRMELRDSRGYSIHSTDHGYHRTKR